MKTLALEVTNVCNFSCVHCAREKDSPRQEMSPELFRRVVDEARELGIVGLSLTGGEPLLWSGFADAYFRCGELGWQLAFVSNAWEFERVMVPLWQTHERPAPLTQVCFSLDGADAPTHDAFRRAPGSFQRVIRALEICQERGVPVSLKCCLWKQNLDQVFDIAVLARQHRAALGFVFLTPNPQLVERDFLPDPREYERVFHLVNEKIRPLFEEVMTEGLCSWDAPVPTCNPFWSLPSIDQQGHAVFCCNLSSSESPNGSSSGKEYLGSLADASLAEICGRHLFALGEFVRGQIPLPDSAWGRSCAACVARFGKLGWLKETTSPWRFLLEQPHH